MKSPTKSLVLVLAIALAGVTSGLATFSHAGRAAIAPSMAAVLLTLGGCLPALWLSRFVSHGPTRQLVIVGFRFGVLLPAVMLLQRWDGDERNCFIVALLACYFVALSVESWLEVRELKK